MTQSDAIRHAAGRPASDVLSRLTNSGSLTQERLPMLNVVIERLVRLVTTGMRQLTSRNVRVMLEDYEVHRFADAVDGIEKQSMIAVINASQWDNKFLLIADRSLVYACVDILLGGRQREASLDNERSFTPIERRLSERILRLTMQNLEKAFSPITAVDFTLDRLETNPEFAAICRESNATVRARLHVNFGNSGGYISLLLPYATLEPIRKLLLQVFMGERFGHDPVWERHLSNEIKRTQMRIEAILHENTIPLDEVLTWKVGMTIPLNATVKTPARIVCNNKVIFRGEVGQANGNVAVKVETAALDQQEFINDLVSL